MHDCTTPNIDYCFRAAFVKVDDNYFTFFVTVIPPTFFTSKLPSWHEKKSPYNLFETADIWAGLDFHLEISHLLKLEIFTSWIKVLIFTLRFLIFSSFCLASRPFPLAARTSLKKCTLYFLQLEYQVAAPPNLASETCLYISLYFLCIFLNFFCIFRNFALPNLASETFPPPILLLASPTVPTEPASRDLSICQVLQSPYLIKGSLVQAESYHQYGK